MSSHHDIGRRRTRIFGFVVAGIFLAIAGASVAPDVAYWWGARELRAGSSVVDGPPVEVERVPTTYRASLRVENRAGGRLVLNEEKVWFRRPFDSRIETYRDGKRSSLRQSTLGEFANASSGSDKPLNLAAPPSLASGDVRIDAVLEEAVREKEIVRRERREVYGRACQVYRAGGPASAGDLTRYDPDNEDDYADLCIDEHGLILEEYWVQDDGLLRRRAVTELEVDIALDDDLFEITTENSPEVDRGSFMKVRDDSENRAPLWLPPEAPDGFERLGRYAVTLSSQASPQLSGIPAPAATSKSDVYVRGPDLIVIDQDPSLTGITSQESRPMHDIDVGALGQGKLIVDARMSEVRALTDEGSLVRVIGTVPPAELVALARTLEEEETG